MKKIIQSVCFLIIAAPLVLGTSLGYAKEKQGGPAKGFEKGNKKGFEEGEPRGWSQGKKTGWKGEDLPPGLAKKQTEEEDETRNRIIRKAGKAEGSDKHE